MTPMEESLSSLLDRLTSDSGVPAEVYLRKSKCGSYFIAGAENEEYRTVSANGKTIEEALKNLQLVLAGENLRDDYKPIEPKKGFRNFRTNT